MTILEATAEVLSGRRRVFYGWWMLAACVVAMALGGGVSFWSFGLYVNPIEDEFGWSRAEVSLGFSFSLLAGGLCGPIAGHLIDTRGPRASILLGAVVASGSYFLLASTDSLWQWYLFNSINAACRQFMFIIPFQTLVSRWFDRKRGLALSFLGSGFSLGGLTVVPLMTWVIDSLGWRGGFIFSGVILACVFVPITLLVLRDQPRDLDSHPDGEAPSDRRTTSASMSGISLGHAIRLPIFWVLALALMLLLYGMLGWQVHQVPFFESKGFSRGTVALIVALSAGAGMIARVIMGLYADRFARFEVAIMVLAGILILANVTLLLGASVEAISVFLLLWVIGTSAGPIVEALVLTRAFGLIHFASIFGAIIVIEMAGQIVSPTVAGAIFDSTGSYDWALVMFIGTYAAAALLFGIASRMKQPLGEE